MPEVPCFRCGAEMQERKVGPIVLQACPKCGANLWACGCKTWRLNNKFWIVPCNAACPVLHTTMRLTKQRGKPVEFHTLEKPRGDIGG